MGGVALRAAINSGRRLGFFLAFTVQTQTAVGTRGLSFVIVGGSAGAIAETIPLFFFGDLFSAVGA
jgi:hypothetical protein